eukprot:gene12152-5642_t
MSTDDSSVLKLYAIGQNFESLLNDPKNTSKDSWFKNYFFNETPTKEAQYPNVSLDFYNDYIEKTCKKFDDLKEFKQKLKDLNIEKVDSVKYLLDQEAVPPIFFDKNFEIENKEMFNEIFPTESLKRPLLYLEKLTHYVDLVETHLVHEVSIKREEVLKIMIQYNGLCNEVHDTLPIIRELRTKISELEQLSVATPLNVHRYMRRKANYNNLLEQLERLQIINESLKTIEHIHQTNFVDTFNLIDETKNVLKNELFGLKCTEQINEKLIKFTVATKKHLVNDFVQLLTISKDQDLEMLLTLFEILIEKNHIITALSSFREILINQTKLKIKQVLDECLNLILQNKTYNVQGSSLDKKIQSLSHSHFIFLISSVFESLMGIINHCNYIKELIISFCKKNQSDKYTTTYLNTELEILKIFEGICEICHHHCYLIFKNRNSLMSDISKEDLLSIMEYSFSFIENTEKLFNEEKKMKSLRGILSTQSQIYLDSFDQDRLINFKKILELENWSWEPSISKSNQLLLDDFLINEEKLEKKIEREVKYLYINNDAFPICKSLLVLFQEINEYTTFFHPKYYFINSVDLISRIIKFLNTYNYQMRELVLGAKAMSTAGLKTITAKHLLLSSECLNCLIYFIPILKEWIKDKLQSKQYSLLNSLDMFLKDCIDHKNKIYDKIIEIMTTRLEITSKMFVDNNWNEIDEKSPSSIIVNTLREIGILHKLIKEYLGTHSLNVKKIFTRVISLYVNRFKDLTVYLKTKINSPNGKKKLWDDLQFFSSHLSKKFSDDLTIDLNVLQENYVKHFEIDFRE